MVAISCRAAAGVAPRTIEEQTDGYRAQTIVEQDVLVVCRVS